ncbi:hypothetical protein [Paenibacillus tianmuensis]|uniref:hypothetical protein n=1 Tax=Paenibacillus tianmuensis TaxID=624147 RepID=UPI001C25B36B|nr:hypothetical protein [Paenibacillus tianmuensis]
MKSDALVCGGMPSTIVATRAVISIRSLTPERKCAPNEYECLPICCIIFSVPCVCSIDRDITKEWIIAKKVLLSTFIGASLFSGLAVNNAHAHPAGDLDDIFKNGKILKIIEIFH